MRNTGYYFVADPNDKMACISESKKHESRFEARVKKFAHIERGDEKDLSKPDFLITFKVDHKNRNEMFQMAKLYVGMESKETLSLNINKLKKYSDDTWIAFESHFEPKGLYVITAKRARKLYAQFPKRVHTYKPRGPGNAPQSFYISKSECLRIPDVLYAVE